jgi:CBS-domain-containing membrane protein
LVIDCVFLRAGATALNAAVEAEIVSLSWRYIPTVLASSLIMLGWALIVNNLGRRRYPIYWWSPGVTFVSTSEEKDAEIRKDELMEVEEGLGITEGVLFNQVSNGRSASGTLHDEAAPSRSRSS